MSYLTDLTSFPITIERPVGAEVLRTDGNVPNRQGSFHQESIQEEQQVQRPCGWSQLGTQQMLQGAVPWERVESCSG